MKITFADENGLVLNVVERNDGPFLNRVPVTAELLAKAGRTLNISFIQPVIDVQGYWNSALFRPEMSLPWSLEFCSAAQRDMPLHVFYNLKGINRGTYGLTDLVDDACLTSSLSQNDGVFEMNWAVSISPETAPFEFIADFRDVPFPEVVTAFRLLTVPEDIEFPDAAWEPVYCTWYAFFASYTIPELEKNAAEARRLGFGTFILDDGWSYDASKRLTPSTVSDWFSDDGDWQLSEKKLPDFASHVDRIKAMGFNYLLWSSLFLVGDRSEMYRKLKERGSIVREIGDGSTAVDPADPLVMEVTVPRIVKMFETYKLDGLKIDFVDMLKPDMAKPRGRACLNAVRDCVEKVRKTKPDALIEFRQHYTTPAMLPYGTNFRANDVPYDFMENLHRCCQIRMVLGDGVPVHADPIAFHPDESPVNVARHLIGSLAGVPMISSDLETISDVNKDIIRRFIQFYHKHLATFKTGYWTIHYEYGHVAWLRVESETEQIVTIVSDVPELPDDKDVYLLNMGTKEIHCEGDGEDCLGRPVDSLVPGGMMAVCAGE